MNLSAVPPQTPFGTILRLPLRLVPSHARVPVMQGPLRGKLWIVGSSNHGCWLGSYEYAKQKAFAAAVRPGDSVYDLGANVGLYSLLASALVGPAGSVFSFEPAPRNLRFLRMHLKLNHVGNCFVWDAAVGRFEGTAYFDPGPNPLEGRLTPKPYGALEVRTVSLDRLVASGALPPPNLIKCDIEGAEYDALQGASEILATHRPTIFLSTHGPELHRACCRLLTGLRYRLSPLDALPLSRTTEVIATRHA